MSAFDEFQRRRNEQGEPLNTEDLRIALDELSGYEQEFRPDLLQAQNDFEEYYESTQFRSRFSEAARDPEQINSAEKDYFDAVKRPDPDREYLEMHVFQLSEALSDDEIQELEEDHLYLLDRVVMDMDYREHADPDGLNRMREAYQDRLEADLANEDHSVNISDEFADISGDLARRIERKERQYDTLIERMTTKAAKMSLYTDLPGAVSRIQEYRNLPEIEQDSGELNMREFHAFKVASVAGLSQFKALNDEQRETLDTVGQGFGKNENNPNPDTHAPQFRELNEQYEPWLDEYADDYAETLRNGLAIEKGQAIEQVRKNYEEEQKFNKLLEKPTGAEGPDLDLDDENELDGWT